MWEHNMKTKKEKQIGVYSLTCTVNNKVYIGSSRKDINGRRSGHMSDLRHRKHASKEMQADFDLYGEAAFEFAVIEITSKEDAYDVECREIRKRKATDPKFGYNIEEDARRGGARINNGGGWNRSPHGPLRRVTVQLSPELHEFLRTQDSQGGWLETMARGTAEFTLWQSQQPKPS